MNSCHFYGHLCSDPELRPAGGTSVVKFRIAVNRRYKKGDETVEEASFFDMEAWGKTGELIHQYYKKGSGILVHCRAKLDQWEDKDNNQKRSRVVFVVENLFFTNGKSEGGEEKKTSRSGGKAPAKSSYQAPVADDENIPF